MRKTMIASATVEDFRGLRRLEVQGFGRVNLIIGRNNCGKTALMEALGVVDSGEDCGRALAGQQERRVPDCPIQDVDRFWAPLFRDQDSKRGLSISTRTAGGDEAGISVRRVSAPAELITDELAKGSSLRSAWAIEVRVKSEGREKYHQIVGTSRGVQFPPGTGDAGSAWVRPSKSVGAIEIGLFSRLKQTGRDTELLDVLKEIDDQVTGLELLSPGGTEAELFVRQEAGALLLPLAMMGDGFQRCLEVGLAASAHDWPTLFVDEIDNGLHHSVLVPVWRWLAAMSRQRDLQVFATTHSEECIQAACQAFMALDDDGLRVIRLDRREDRTTAAVYDRALVEAAMRTDVEIRG